MAQVEPLPDAPAEPVEQVAEAGDMAESGDPPHPPDLDTQADATPRPSEGDALIHALLEHLLGQASRSGDAASEADRAELMQAEPTPQVAHAAPAEDTTPSVPAAEPASPDRAELAETSTEAETVSDAPVAEDAGRVFDESEVDAPIRFRRQVRPTAPALSRRHNETGSVVVLIRVDAAGVLDDVRVLDDAGHPRLVEAALKALRRSTFAPATRGGEPVTSTRRVEYRF